MPVAVRPVTEDDFERWRSLTLSSGHLTSPVMPFVWPVESEQDGAERNNWSIDQQLDIMKFDDTAHFWKAVDTDRNDEIMALARWHYYPTGYKTNDLEYAGSKDKDDSSAYPSSGMNVDLYKAMLEPIFEARSGWTVSGPQWTLTTLKTRESERCRGAGTRLVEWGVNQAKEACCPAYLEAEPKAVSLYQKCGFKEVGQLKIDKGRTGLAEDIVLLRMAANV